MSNPICVTCKVRTPTIQSSTCCNAQLCRDCGLLHAQALQIGFTQKWKCAICSRRLADTTKLQAPCELLYLCFHCNTVVCRTCNQKTYNNQFAPTFMTNTECKLCSEQVCRKCFWETPNHVLRCSECPVLCCGVFKYKTASVLFNCLLCNRLQPLPAHKEVIAPECKKCQQDKSAAEKRNPINRMRKACHQCFDFWQKKMIPCHCSLRKYCSDHDKQLIQRNYQGGRCAGCKRLRLQMNDLLIETETMSILPEVILDLILDYTSHYAMKIFRPNPTARRLIHEQRLLSRQAIWCHSERPWSRVKTNRGKERETLYTNAKIDQMD